MKRMNNSGKSWGEYSRRELVAVMAIIVPILFSVTLKSVGGGAHVKSATQRSKRFRPSNSLLEKAPAFAWPIARKQFWISSYFGWRARKRLHAGIDMAAIKGTPVKAAASGIVEEACVAGGFGKMVLISHNDAYKSRYAHLHRILVPPGKKVKKGQVIGYVGNSGHVRGKNGHHLHFEILATNQAINPMRFLA